MSALREEIRAILREELAALQGAQPVTETVRISSSAELTQFAQEIVARAESPDFVAQLNSGQLNFALAQASPEQAARVNQVTHVSGVSRVARSLVTSPVTTSGVTLNKKLITENDITCLGDSTSILRVSVQSRITPLANDEARRKGIRIERIKE